MSDYLEVLAWRTIVTGRTAAVPIVRASTGFRFGEPEVVPAWVPDDDEPSEGERHVGVDEEGPGPEARGDQSLGDDGEPEPGEHRLDEVGRDVESVQSPKEVRPGTPRPGRLRTDLRVDAASDPNEAPAAPSAREPLREPLGDRVAPDRAEVARPAITTLRPTIEWSEEEVPARAVKGSGSKDSPLPDRNAVTPRVVSPVPVVVASPVSADTQSAPAFPVSRPVPGAAAEYRYLPAIEAPRDSGEPIAVRVPGDSRVRHDPEISSSLILPGVARVAVAPSPVAGPPGPAQPAPTIHVTIGRVEIRAMPSPLTAKPATPRRPLMSLEDYLARRAPGSGG